MVLPLALTVSVKVRIASSFAFGAVKVGLAMLAPVSVTLGASFAFWIQASVIASPSASLAEPYRVTGLRPSRRSGPDLR